MFEHILVPLDGSRFGARALKYANEIAKDFGSSITLMQVVKPATPVPVTPGVIPVTESPLSVKVSMEVAEKDDERHALRAKRYLSRKVRENKAHGINTLYVVEVGNSAESIIRYTRKNHIDLVVMTTHGKGGIRRAIMGSVADEVIRKSKKPVLVINPYKK